MLRRHGLAILASLILLSFAGIAAQANVAPPLDEFKLGVVLKFTADGPRVLKLDKNGEAAKDGLQIGDLILAIDQRYAKAMSKDDIKAFANGPHAWPIQLVVVRGDEDIVMIEIES